MTPLALWRALFMPTTISWQADVALNIGFLGMVIHAVNIIYQTGGIAESTQAFWLPLLIVAFYLSARLYTATTWSLLVVLVSGWMVNGHLSGQVFPNVELSPTSLAIEAWSGFLMPLVVIVVAQAWVSRQRQVAIEQAELAYKASEAIAEQAKQGESQLSDVLEKASGNAESLTQVSGVIEQQSSALHR
ncbi:hypothetical protein [Photobacterium pectinilyticum]|uniref:hypothetical protein n=1 Tax=Photobacterium pectinilyticum TaxID=2906793 RepID=UPI0035A1C4C2